MKRLAWTVLRLREKVVKSIRGDQRKLPHQEFNDYLDMYLNLHRKRNLSSLLKD